MRPEPRIPGAERLLPLAIQHPGANLQQEMGAPLAPLHLLLFHHALADHLVHGRFDKARADALAVAVPLAIVGDKARIVRDVGVNSSTAFRSFLAVPSLLVATATWALGAPASPAATPNAWAALASRSAKSEESSEWIR